MCMRNQALKCSNTSFNGKTDTKKVTLFSICYDENSFISNPNPWILRKRDLERSVGET